MSGSVFEDDLLLHLVQGVVVAVATRRRWVRVWPGRSRSDHSASIAPRIDDLDIWLQVDLIVTRGAVLVLAVELLEKTEFERLTDQSQIWSEAYCCVDLVHKSGRIGIVGQQIGHLCELFTWLGLDKRLAIYDVLCYLFHKRDWSAYSDSFCPFLVSWR